jgi:ribosomal protein L32E
MFGENIVTDQRFLEQIGFGSNKKTRFLTPSGHKAFLVSNTQDVELLLMHNRTFAAEYVLNTHPEHPSLNEGT